MSLEIKLTDNCNLSCDYCYYSDTIKHSDLSFDDVILLIDYFRKVIIPKNIPYYNITFFGGESLLKADLILRIVDYYNQNYKNSGLVFHICTNGILLDSKLISELKRRSIGIYVSLDGNKDVHDTHRCLANGKGSFNQIEPKLLKIAENCEAVQQVITPETAHRLYDSFIFLLEKGFKQIVAIPDFSSDWSYDSLQVLKSQYKKLIQYKKNTGGVYFSIIDDKLRLIKSGVSYKNHSCNLGKQTYVVNTNGKIYPCTRLAQDIEGNEWSIGCIKNGIDWKKRNELLSVHAVDREVCADCLIKNLCLGSCCACISFSYDKTITSVSPLVCEHERMLVELISDSYY